MRNLYNRSSEEEEIAVIVHLSEDPIVLQRRAAELDGIPFTDEAYKKADAAVNLQQQRVIHEMAARNIRVSEVQPFRTVLNAFSAIIRRKDIGKVRSLKEVVWIEPDVQVRGAVATSAACPSDNETEIDRLFPELQALWADGIEGQGIKVAVLDSGIDKNHPDLKDVYKGGKNFVDQSNPEEYARSREEDDPSETSPAERPEGAPEKHPSTGAAFESYHGTHIAGILAGKNGVRGVAPKIELYAYRVFGAYTAGKTSYLLKGIEEAVAQKMDIINLSLSLDSDLETHAVSIALNHAVMAGIVAISTAGNTGPVRGSVRAPGTSRLGISVGNSTRDDQVDSSSSRGPSKPDFDIKPDVLAPGTEVFSTMPRYVEDKSGAIYKDAYKRETGTSQAAPYIAGVAALIKQAHPDWTPFDIKVALSNTARVLDTEKFDVFDQGAGRVQPYEAVHPAILAYSIEKVEMNGEGELVENPKGTVTFGSVSLDEDISISKQLLVKDIKGTGGEYDVTVQVIKAFGDAEVTINPPSFTLNGEQRLQVSLKASKNPNTKYRDELTGYIRIANRDQSVEISLPFAADFSNGATVTPAIEEFRMTKTDLSFTETEAGGHVAVRLSVNTDVSYPSLELVNYITKEPVDSLFYQDGISLGTREFPILQRYKSSWSGEETLLADGIYSVNFTGMVKALALNASIGPVFVKTTKPVVTASIDAASVKGQVTDHYIEFNQALEEIGEGFELNEKLQASYILTKNGQSGEAVSFLLNQDGTFSFELPSFEAGKDLLSIVVTDAAGNAAECLVQREE
ncbi:S8 family peptidase [Sporosarcina cyprini]|uniref:S8 family peptidase n=1 Tax=Sporosarcina cyprini TaxID=2910523 RepID=UPI001EDFB899|nr:S8 family serine peptidase [Sporosarcina cyprini]MCG3087786.1 S8 family serine peptidase [Sporosarcina cyprini]